MSERQIEKYETELQLILSGVDQETMDQISELDDSEESGEARDYKSE